MDYKKEIEEVLNRGIFDLFDFKKNPEFFVEDIEGIAKENGITTKEVLDTFKIYYNKINSFLQYYNRLKGLNENVLCARIIKSLSELKRELEAFTNSRFFVDEEGNLSYYFWGVRSTLIRNTSGILGLNRFIGLITSIFELIEKITKECIKGNVSGFYELTKDLFERLNRLMIIFDILDRIKDKKLELSERRHRQIIAKNGIPVDVIKEISYKFGELNILCIGGVITLKDLKEDDKYLEYSFLRNIGQELIDNETPFGKEATLIYRIENGQLLLNRLESANRGFKHYEEREEIEKIDRLKEEINPNKKVGYIIQVNVIKEKRRSGYSTALVDIANFEIFEQDGVDIAYTIVLSDNPDGEKMIGVFEKAGFVFIRSISEIGRELSRPDIGKSRCNLGIRFKEKAKTIEFERLLKKVEDFLAGKK